jgi:surface protein
LANALFQFAFTNELGKLFAVLTTTNITLPLSNWNTPGTATEMSSGRLRFSNPQATTNPRHFYRVSTP